MIYDFRFQIYDLMITIKPNSPTKSKKNRASGIFRIKITKDLAMRLQQHQTTPSTALDMTILLFNNLNRKS
jgi:hypothetical protein